MRSEMEIEMRVETPMREEKLEAESVNEDRLASQRVLSPGQWMRTVLGFEAPFGHDGLPTVWG
jgi:hypothetical protein